MPGLNGTGPSGKGPMTGGGCGRCADKANASAGIGRGLACGRGRGCKRYANREPITEQNNSKRIKSATDNSENENEILRQQKSDLEARITVLNSTIDELKAANTPESKKKKH